MHFKEVTEKLQHLANPDSIAGMTKFGIQGNNILGISMPNLRKLAKEIKKDHLLALKLFESNIHEGKILASLVAEKEFLDSSLMEKWVLSFDSWDVTDQVCMNLFRYSPLAFEKAISWSSRKEEYVKRASFALIASLAILKEHQDNTFLPFLPIIERESKDERNFVKKAVNWALRGIGKRSPFLKEEALKTAHSIKQQKSKSARWIATDAIRELIKN